MATFQAIFVLFAVITSSKKVHHCIHDTLDITATQQHVNYHNHPYDMFHHESSNANDRRKLVESANYAPIRISPYYDPQTITTSNPLLTTHDIEYIKKVVSSTIRYFEQFLSVIPVDGPLFLTPCTWYTTFTDTTGQFRSFTRCTAAELDYVCGHTTIPGDHISEVWVYNDTAYASRRHEESGAGIADTDLVIYVSFDQSECTGDTLAYASFCIQDQYGRPIAGYMNFCSLLFDEMSWKTDVMVVLHELTHVLVFSSALYNSYYNVDDGDFYYESDVVLNKSLTDTSNSWIITDKVKAHASDHFGCDSILGAPIENSGGSGTAGSHWEGKYINHEYMMGISFDALQRVSQFTLALFEDSGWYKVDYNYAESYTWGRDEGCGFLDNKCIDNGISPYPQFWCDSVDDHGCTADYTAIGWCLLYENVYDPGDIPVRFQYWTDTVGGTDMHDYCGFIDVTPSGNFSHVCWDERGNTLDQYSPAFSSYALDSRCVETSDGVNEGVGYCFKHECTGFDAGTATYSGVDITVGSDEVVSCSRDDILSTKPVSILGLSTITCPNIDAVCVSTKPFGCYWGEYNDELMQCICSAGYTGSLCDATDDATLVDEATAAISSPGDTTTHDAVCISGIDVANAQFLNGFYSAFGENEGIPAYYKVNDTYGGDFIYIYFQRYDARWVFGGTGIFGYCRQYVSAGDDPDIEECNIWNINDQHTYVLQTGVSVEYDTEVCDADDAPNRFWVNIWMQYVFVFSVFVVF